jgi:hypothetical protein
MNKLTAGDSRHWHSGFEFSHDAIGAAFGPSIFARSLSLGFLHKFVDAYSLYPQMLKFDLLLSSEHFEASRCHTAGFQWAVKLQMSCFQLGRRACCNGEYLKGSKK